ncbi:MAG: T9SS type A sorting domain-containing protein [Flavobacteriales bacterium]|nr:T9SS type A sorting domain-containing protein [Flavobacteriales bacterium]
MNFKYFFLTIIISLIGFHSTAQHDHFSEDDIMTMEGFKKAYPEFAAQAEAETKKLEEHTKAFMAAEALSGSRGASDYIIPVVFHVLHEGGPENVSDLVIHDAIRILNEDFNKLNPDTSDVVSSFKNSIGNAKIEFRLAKKDPQGKPHTGIDRIYTSLTNNAGESSKLNTWSRASYLNIWIVKTIGSGAAGYTFLPGTANWMPSRDGIILLYNYFGAIRSGNARLSRALTHEIGHWLNLPHTWGGTNDPGVAANCQDDDGVWDTPNTIGWQSCNLNGTTCNSLDNVQNYMDYSYCSMMFTHGQASRMRAALNSSTAERNKLVSASNNLNAGVLDLVEVKISASNRTVCVGETIELKDESFYDVVSWNWEFEGANITSSTSKYPKVVYDKPGLYDVKLTVGQLSGSTKSFTFKGYIRVNRSVGALIPYAEDFSFTSNHDASSWIVQNENEDAYTWKIDASGNGHNNPGYLRLDNFSNLFYQEEAIISPTIDISNMINPKLSFSVATAQKTAVSTDYLRVYVSKDCGATWELRYNAVTINLAEGKTSTSPFFPTKKSDWKQVQLNPFGLNDLVDNLMLKFEVVNGGGNNYFIDDILISGAFQDVPSLKFPRNGMDSVSNKIVLDWRSVPFSDKYEFELATDTGFTNIVSTGIIDYISEDPNGADTRFQTKNLVNGATYYWRVRSLRGTLVSDWSSVWSFTISPNGLGHKNLDGLETEEPDGVSERIEDFRFKLFPNPTKDAVHLQITSSSKGFVDINILSVDGKLVFKQGYAYSEGSEKIDLPIQNLDKGIYFVTLKMGNNTTSKKLVIQ